MRYIFGHAVLLAYLLCKRDSENYVIISWMYVLTDVTTLGNMYLPCLGLHGKLKWAPPVLQPHFRMTTTRLKGICQAFIPLLRMKILRGYSISWKCFSPLISELEFIIRC